MANWLLVSNVNHAAGLMASKLTKSGYAKLDLIIEENGEEWLLKNLITRVAEGHSPNDIAASIGLPYWVLRAYIEDNCAEDIALAGRARADCLEYEAMEAVNSADPDNLGVAKLHADHKLKIASRLDRAKYSEKDVKEQSGGNGLALPQFIISFVNSNPVNHHEKIIIEHEKERLIIESE